MNFKDKICLVTGGASGIGEHIVLSLLNNGIQHVSILDVNEQYGANACKKLQDKHGELKVSFVKVDVRNEKEFEGAFLKIINKFGKIDIVVNNAGVANECDYQFMIDVNLKGVIRGTHLALKYITKTQKTKSNQELVSPIILNIASASAFLDFIIIPEYAATKGGIVSFVRSLGVKSHFNRTGVRVVALCPGYTPGTNLLTEKSAEYREEEEEFLKDEKEQSIDAVGRAAIEVMNRGTTGTVWVVDGGDLFKVKLPHLKTCTELVHKNV